MLTVWWGVGLCPVAGCDDMYNTKCDPSFDQIWGEFKKKMLQEPCNSLNHVPAWFAHFYMANNEFKSVCCNNHWNRFLTQKLVGSPELLKMLYITACCKQLILFCHPLFMQTCKRKAENWKQINFPPQTKAKGKSYYTPSMQLGGFSSIGVDITTA